MSCGGLRRPLAAQHSAITVNVMLMASRFEAPALMRHESGFHSD